VLSKLVANKQLEIKYKNHALVGN